MKKNFTLILCALMVLLSVNAAPQVKAGLAGKTTEIAKVEKQQLSDIAKPDGKLQKQARYAAPSAVATPAKAPKAKKATVDITISTDVKLTDATSEGWWQITAENTDYYVTLSNDGTVSQVAGTYDVAALDAEYSYIADATDTKINLASGSVTITFTDTYGSFTVVGSFVGSDDNTYNINLTYTAEKFKLIGKATVTATYLSMFQNATEQTDELNVYESEETKGIYKIDNALSAAGDPIIIYAQDPELVYILPTELAYYNTSYGYIMIASQGGRYVDAGYTPTAIAANFGTGTDYWGKKVKNVISFAGDAIKPGLSAYNGGTWFNAGQRFIVELPDLENPTITAVNEVSIGGTKAIVEVVADDDADIVDSLTFTVKNGETTILENAKTTDGKLTITGLTISTTYNLTIIATDRSGKSSEAFAFTLTTGTTDDTEAPVLTKATLKEVSDKWATIEVAATDNITAVANIVYVVTFADASTVTLKAEEGVIKLTGLTPETAYAVTVAPKDEANNIGTASETINFKTLEIIPIVMNIDWVQAEYYSQYSSAGAYNFEIGYWEGDDNYVTLDTYTKKNNAISGTWSTADGTIEAAYSGITYNGATVKVVSATQTLEFVSLDASTNQATYNTSFEVMGADGNLYKGSFTTQVLTYTGSTYVSMEGELPDTTAPTLTNASVTLGSDFTSATITVRASDNETATGSIKVELQQEDGTKVADFTYRSNQFSATVTGLTPDTEYTYYIAAEDEAGNKTAAADRLKVTFKTADEDAPTFSGNITVQAKTATTATLRVAARDNATPVGELTLYAALDEAGENKISENFEVGTKSTTLAYYSGTATGLTPSTTYTLYVIAVDKAGNKAAKSVSVTTEAAPNEAPVIGEIVANPSDNGVTITIEASDDNTAAANLDVIIMDANQVEVAYGEYNAATGLFEATITNLTGNTEYTFTVWVYDEASKYTTKSFGFTTYATGIGNTAADAKAAKVIENGTLVIIKNGVKYDATGTIIR